MAKSTKFISKVPKLEDYSPSFVTGEGDDREVNVDAALKALHTLALDKAKAQDAAEDVKAELAERTTERDELQAKVDDKNAPDAQVEIAKAKEKATAAEAKAAAETLRADRLEVAMEKGLTPAQAKRIVGATKEELEADADELLAEWGPAKSAEEDPEDEENEGRQVPRTVINSSDPKLGSTGDKGFDYDAWANDQAAKRF